MAVTDVVHPAATARNDTLNLLSLVHLGWLVPVCTHRKENITVCKVAQVLEPLHGYIVCDRAGQYHGKMNHYLLGHIMIQLDHNISPSSTY